ncbi:hypothetical protein [uncultured Abyssibacter sp.]|uniref:hypothetical protein n=1 Tax=uncultured Abyssibacter sp. TaxID=2320202 RepID=UPI0032B1C6B2|tara:strand:- start:639 stop:914 length:276 start_codon:yes stop_codon:yes gene_type:complete
MNIPITNPTELGELIRAVRKTQRVRMDDIPGMSHVFVRDVERGKPTAQIGLVMALLDELGIRLVADVPDEAVSRLDDKPLGEESTPPNQER